jgi:hypothetical protein
MLECFGRATEIRCRVTLRSDLLAQGLVCLSRLSLVVHPQDERFVNGACDCCRDLTRPVKKEIRRAWCSFNVWRRRSERVGSEWAGSAWPITGGWGGAVDKSAVRRRTATGRAPLGVSPNMGST